MDILMIINHAITALLLLIVIMVVCIEEPQTNKKTDKELKDVKIEDPLKRLKKGNAVWYRNGKWYEDINGKLELYYDENA